MTGLNQIWPHNREGYTLVEIAVTTILISVIATLALPNLTTSGERSRSAEGVQILSAIWQSQQLYALENNGAVGTLANLDIDVPTSTDWFSAPVLWTSNGQTAYIDRNNSYYRLYVSNTGAITCDDVPGRAGICTRMGITAYPF